MTTKEKEVKVKRNIARMLKKIFPDDFELTKEIVDKVFGTTIAIANGDDRCRKYAIFASEELVIFKVPIDGVYSININCFMNGTERPKIAYGVSSINTNLKVG